MDELVAGTAAKGVHLVGTVDGDPGGAVAHFVEDVFVVHGLVLDVFRDGRRVVQGQPCIVRPPDTLSTWPVMKAASSLAKNRMAPGRSSGWPMRPRGMERVKASISFSGLPAPSLYSAKSAVSVGPGHTTLTVMPWRACSRA